MKIIKSISTHIHNITNIGVQKKLNYNEVRFLQFTNITVLALFLIGLSGLFIFIKEITYNSDANIVQAVVAILLMIASVYIIYLNHLHHYKYAKFLLIFSPILSIIILSITLQQTSGITFYYMLAPIGLLVFIGLNIYAYLLIALMYVIMLATNFYQNNYEALYPMPEFLIPLNYTINLSNTFLVITMLIYFLIRINQNMEKKLITIMETDALTGLYNRHKYSEFSEKNYQEAMINNYNISVIIFDLDYFKSYNDNYGHLAGDEALAKVATVLQNNIQRKTDLIARFGGEEFVAILINTSMNEALLLSTKILNDIQDLSIESNSSVYKVITCSAGLATIKPQDNSKYIDLFIQADANLYQAKEEGRNRVVSSNISI